jgi:hypothetical protein
MHEKNRPGEQGEVDAWILCFFMVLFQLMAWQVWVQIGTALEDAFRALDSAEGREFQALQESWEAPAPRIDYGAHYQREKDAEALCYIVRCCMSETESRLFHCD